MSAELLDGTDVLIIGPAHETYKNTRKAKQEFLAKARMFYQYCAHWGNVPKAYQEMESAAEKLKNAEDDDFVSGVAYLALCNTLEAEFGNPLQKQVRKVVFNLLLDATKQLAEAVTKEDVNALIQRVAPFYWQARVCYGDAPSGHRLCDPLWQDLDAFYADCVTKRSALPPEPKGYFMGKAA